MTKKHYISNSFVTWAKRRNIPVTYKTVVLVPYYDGYKNVLTQDMINEENVKYVIKHDYWLNGETITVPENSILEFDGGSLHDGTIIGQDTFINDIGGLGLEKLFAEDIVREGTWRINGEQVQSDWNQNDNTKPDYIKNKPTIPEEVTVDTALSKISTNPVQNKVIAEALENVGGNSDKPYDPTTHSGLGRKTLKIKDGSNVLYQSDFDQDHTVYVLANDFVLGEDITVPVGCILDFEGGSISNSENNSYTLSGTSTQIKAVKVSIFTKMLIGGTWNCPEITSAWFSDATNDNMLKQVFNLTNEDIDNTVKIVSGNYSVSAQNEGEMIIIITSNTHVENMGTITLAANNLDTYYIFSIGKGNTNKVSNISFKGGTIIGDKNTHTGSLGEHGMGMAITNAENVYVSDVEIKDCWGDSIYIGHSTWGKAVNVTVEHFKLSGSRRQGISIINSKNIVIRNGEISNIAGTPPEAGIDIEPNINTDTNEGIIIENIVFDSERGVIITRGYLVTTSEKTNREITVRNCAFKRSGFKTPILMSFCADVEFSNNELNDISENRVSTDESQAFFVSTSENVRIYNNIINTNRPSVFRNDHFLQIIGNIINNTYDDEDTADGNGSLLRKAALISESIFKNNRISCSGDILLPSYTTFEGNSVTSCKTFNVASTCTISNSIIICEAIVTSSSIFTNCRLICSGNLDNSYNSTFDNCTLRFKKFMLSAGKAISCNFTIDHLNISNVYLYGCGITSNENKYLEADYRYNTFIAIGSYSIMEGCIITHRVHDEEDVSKPYQDQVIYLGGNYAKVSNCHFICEQKLDIGVANSAWDTENSVFINNTVSRYADNGEVYVSRDYTHNNKVIPPIKTNGTTVERLALDIFYLIVGFTFFDTTLGASVYVSAISGDAVTWKELDGATVGVARTGTKAQRPVGSDIYPNFMYRQIDAENGNFLIWASSISEDVVTWIKEDGTDPDANA